MKDPNNKILFDIVNNTDKDQVINLFDNGDPTSGGKFTGGSDRIIQYDVSAYAFPNTSPTNVSGTYNSTEVPVNFQQSFLTGALTYPSLLTYLNSLGIGTFVDQGGQVFNCHPNYDLADDNGGLYGVELSIVDNMDIVILELDAATSPVGSVTGNATLNDVNNPAFNASLAILAGSDLIDNNVLINQGNKISTITGTANNTGSVNCYLNATFITGTNWFGASNFTHTTPPVVMGPTDTLKWVIFVQP